MKAVITLDDRDQARLFLRQCLRFWLPSLPASNSTGDLFAALDLHSYAELQVAAAKLKDRFHKAHSPHHSVEVSCWSYPASNPGPNSLLTFRWWLREDMHVRVTQEGHQWEFALVGVDPRTLEGNLACLCDAQRDISGQ